MSGSGLKNTMNLVFAAILFFLTDANMDAGVGEIAVGEMLKDRKMESGPSTSSG